MNRGPSDPSGQPESPEQADAGRRRHFGHFYDLLDIPEDPDRPFVVVHGNCQAGSVRRLVETAGAVAVRMPPVHELTEEDLPFLDRLLRRTDVLLSQPIRHDYRGLPLGHEQLAEALPPGADLVLFPSLRFAAPFPFQVTVRPDFAPSVDPPRVPFHDLRTLVIAAEFPDHEVFDAAPAARFDELTEAVSPEAIRALAEDSVAQMAAREERSGAVRVSPLLAEDATVYRTHHCLNHPTNRFFERVAEVVVAGINAAHGTDLDPHPAAPDAEMLGGIRARIEKPVAEAFPYPVHDWVVDGVDLPQEAVRDAQLRWYRENPGFVDAGLRAHAGTLEMLGLPVPVSGSAR